MPDMRSRWGARAAGTPASHRTAGHARLRRAGLGVALLLLFARAAPLAGQEGAPRTLGPDSASLAALAGELAEIVAESEVPGASVALVSRAGPVWSAGFGSADVAARRPVAPGTLFRANSVSKSFVALAMLRLHEQGRLRLDAPLREVAPEIAFENRWERSHPVRVAHLLEHTTGFDELHLQEYTFGAEDGSLGDALAVNPAPRTTRWPPGTLMAYNNGGYAVAAYLIEKVTRQPFESFIEREILEPLGMHDTGFGVENVDRARMSALYVGPTEEEPVRPYPAVIRPAGALISSADDLAELVHLLLRRGAPLVSDAALTRMETPRTTEAARAGLRVGYGLGSYTARGEGHLWHGHAGGTPAAFARYAYQPEVGVGYVILMNGADAATRRRLEGTIQRFLVAGRTVPTAPPAPPPPGDLLAAYEGMYRQSTASWQLTAGIERLLDVQRVRVGEGGVILAPLLGDLPEALVPAGADRFRSAGDAVPAAVFLRGAGGEVTGLRTWDAENIRAGNYERVAPVGVYLPLLLLALCTVLAVSALVVLPFHSAAAFFRRSVPDRGLAVRWLPLLAVLLLLAAVGLLVAGLASEDAVQALGRPTPTSVGFWALTWAFAVLSPVALVVTTRALRRRPRIHRVIRVHSFLVALACTTLALYLTSWGIIGLRTWAF